MKKVALLLAFIFTVSAGFSQQRKRGMNKQNNITPEQQVTLSVKKLTLALDLTKAQAGQLESLFSKMKDNRKEAVIKMKKNAAESKDKIAKIKKDSKDDAEFKENVGKAIKKGDISRMRNNGGDFNSKNQALDNMIALQVGMKEILTKEQFEKYKKMQKGKAQMAVRQKMDKRKGMKRNR
jgi:periplasmic protein CpxP/Spy